VSGVSPTTVTPDAVIDFELVFAAEPMPSLLVGVDDRFVILAAGDAYLELAQTSRPNLVGQSLLEWLGAAGPDSQLRASLVRARDGRQTDTMPTGPDGRRIVHRPVLDPDGAVRYLIHRVEGQGSEDARAELRASEDRLRQIADAAFVGTWAIDAAGEVFVDPLVVDLFDLPPGGNYTMDDFLARVAAEDRDRIATAVEAAMAGVDGGSFDAEYQSIRLDGTTRWLHGRGRVDFDASGRFVRFIGTVADVTARKEAELERERLLEEVAHARRRLHAQLTQAPVGVSVVSGPELVFQLANSRYLEMTGRKDIVGKSFRAAFPEIEEDAPIFAMLETVYRTGHSYTAEEYKVRLDRRGTGELEDVYFQFTLQPVRDGSDDVTDILTVAIDVTAQVEARTRIETLIRELKIADVRKDEFLATLAHELRNPMAAISTALTLLDRDEGDPTLAAKHRETARRQIQNLTRLVDDMLDVARINRGTFELRKDAVDLAAVVQNAVAATRPLFEGRGHELTVTVAPGAFRTLADGTRLEQVVANLLTNAARYTDAGGRVTVRLAHDDVGGAPWAILRVNDSGRGIPADMLDKIFDLFTQVSPTIDRSTGGLGLGLTLVKRLVEMHGGTSSATSDGPGHGSEFIVRLPIHEVPLPGEATVAGGEFRKRRVLIVEDSEDVRETLKEFLERLGHEVFVAEDGLVGAARLLELLPDVALVDVGLPGIDGYEVARRARSVEAGRKLHVIALTGYGGPEVRARAEAAGFDVHVTKPVDLEWLSEFLSRAERRE